MRFNTYSGTWVLALDSGISRKMSKTKTGCMFRKNLCKLLWTPSRFLVSSTTSFPGQRLNTAHTRFAKEISQGKTSASSLFRPRRLAFASDGVFYFLSVGFRQLPTSNKIEPMSNSIWISDYDVIHRCKTDNFQLSVAAFPGKMNAKYLSQPKNWQAAEWTLEGIGTREEFYVRGNDLVERYTSDEDKLSTEIYSRILPDMDGVELILSRQTSTLDTNAQMALKFRFDDANSVITMNESGQWNPPGLGDNNIANLSDPMVVAVGCLDAVQYAVFVYPGDCSSIQAERQNEETVEVTIPLFSLHLEKGVIRRSRIQFVRAEGKDAMKQLAAKYGSFCDSEIPLTT